MLTTPTMIDNTIRIFYSTGITGGLLIDIHSLRQDRSTTSRLAKKKARRAERSTVRRHTTAGPVVA
jgi:hypothetical protein